MALLKKSEEDTHALRDLLGPGFVLPIRPLAMACVFVKLACNCTMHGIKDDIADVTGSSKFAVRYKGGASPYNGPYKLRWKRTRTSPKQ